MRNSDLYSWFIVIATVLSSFAYAGTPSETQKNWNADSLLDLGEFIASQKIAPEANLVTEPQGASLRPVEVVPATAMFYDGSSNHRLKAVSPSYLKANTPSYSTQLKNITPYTIDVSRNPAMLGNIKTTAYSGISDTWAYQNSQLAAPSQSFTNPVSYKLPDLGLSHYQQQMQQNVLNTIALDVRGIGLSLAGAGTLSTATTIVNATNNFNNIYKVGTGQGHPSILRSICPSAVMGWEMMGPQINPLEERISTKYFSTNFSDGLSSTYSTSKITVIENYNSTAPGIIKQYGFDPATDSMSRTVIRTEHIKTTTGNINHLTNVPIRNYNSNLSFNNSHLSTPKTMDTLRFKPPTYNIPKNNFENAIIINTNKKY